MIGSGGNLNEQTINLLTWVNLVAASEVTKDNFNAFRLKTEFRLNCVAIFFCIYDQINHEFKVEK
jgi:hypothetical protein